MSGRLELSTPGMEDLRLWELWGEELEEAEDGLVGISRSRSLVEERPDRAWDGRWRVILEEVEEAGFSFLLRGLSFSLNGSMMDDSVVSK